MSQTEQGATSDVLRWSSVSLLKDKWGAHENVPYNCMDDSMIVCLRLTSEDVPNPTFARGPSSR